MEYGGDKRGSKFVFIAIVIVIVYLAMFNFDVGKAYDYTVTGVQTALQGIF